MTSVSSVSSNSASTSSSSSTSTTSATTANTNPANIDWTSLITDMVDAKLSAADGYQSQLTQNESKITAYEQMQTLLSSVESAAAELSTPYDTLNTSSNVFLSRSATLTSSGDVAASSVLGVTLQNGAATGSHSVTVSQLAQAQKVASSAVASSSTALGYSGVFQVGAANGTAVDITVDSSMTLADVASAINDQTSTSGIQASVVEVSSTGYELVVTTSQTGEAITASTVSGDDVLNKLGLTDSSGSFANQLQASQDSIFTLDGIQITRNTNEISDVLSGVTFDLYATTPSATSLTLSIGTDTSKVETAIESLVQAYNSYRDFALQQQATDSSVGTAASTAVLFGDGTLRDISDRIASALNSSVNGLSLSSLGLSFNSTNDLQLSSSTLESALSSNLQGIEDLLGARITSSSSDLKLLNAGSATATSFTLDVATDSSGNITSASVNGDSSLFTVSGTRIVGNTGTAYAGLSFSYSGSSSASINVSMSYGIASLLYNVSSGAADSTTGSIQTIISGLQTDDTSLQSRIDNIDSAAATYRQTLTTQYAKYEAAISQAESTKSYLSILLGTSSSSSG